MALFTDGNISTIDDLTAHDTGLLGVAGAEGIDVSRKLELAQDEIGIELAALVPRLDPNGEPVSGGTGLSIENVVVTAPLRLWHAFHTLELVYRDAYYNQLNDRYKGKQQQYGELAKWAWRKLLEAGAGIVQDPVAQAEAPRLSTVPGASSEETTYYVKVAWASARGEEGAAGPWNLITVPVGAAMVVEAVNPPANVAGWNVYVGLSADEQWLQNSAVLQPGSPWVQDAALTAGGRKPGDGQRPSYLRGLPRLLQRW